MTEDAFLKKLFARLPQPTAEVAIPVGDDCAALRLGDGRLLLAAVDQVIGGRHYVLRGPGAATPEQVGRKLLARNLSDIAAMGGKPRYCLVAVALDPTRDDIWLDRFFSGILALARDFAVEIIGGDLARTPADNVASLTILGEVSEKCVCRRTGARPGDLFFATGSFGASLRTGHHITFCPRCHEGEWLARTGFVNAMIDVSDGLLLDATRLCQASGVGLTLNTAAVLRRTADTTLQECLTDGEDYELLLAVPAERQARMQSAWPFPRTPLTCIGEFRACAEPEISDQTGAPLTLAAYPGYDHLRRTDH